MNSKLISAGICALGLVVLATCWTAGVAAMGAPTDNYTITDLPGSSSGYPPIKPSVNFILEGPTSQTDNSFPRIHRRFRKPIGKRHCYGQRELVP